MEWEQPRYNAAGGSGPRRRHQSQQSASYSNNNNATSSYGNDDKKYMKKKLKKLDLFPKIEKDLTVKSDNGNLMTILAYILTTIIVLAEIYNHRSLAKGFTQHVSVDKSLSASMRVDLNITFPALHCDDVHINIMDIVGDSHTNVDTTMKKVRLHLDGSKLTHDEIEVSVNAAHKKELEALEAIDKSLSPNYCGPCYGAQESVDECCNHCNDVIEAYKKRKWSYSTVKALAEQCVREGKTKPKPLIGGEGCELAGYMEFNRVNGNFHVAMGEGVERNGQHIHTFLPEEAPKFNISHVINELRFGQTYGGMELDALEGVTKTLTQDNGMSGMFQYFIKIVPTTYKGKNIVKEMDPTFDTSQEEAKIDTNRYFVTERFIPLMEPDDEHWDLGRLFKTDDDYYSSELYHDDDQEEQGGIAATHVGGNTGSSHAVLQHMKQKAILPGLYFIYQVYPFAVEISRNDVSFTHLLIQILATVGGVFTILGWFDSVLHNRRQKGRNLGR